MLKNRIGWQILIIIGIFFGALLVYGQFFNKSLKKENTIEKFTSDNISSELEIKGKKNAKLKIIVLSSYDCGWSRKYFNETIKPFIDQEINKYDVSLRYDLVSFQNSVSLLGTEAAYCANDQGKFWEANEILWKLGEENIEVNFKKENILTGLANIGLNKQEFNNCLDNHKYLNVILEKGQWYLGKYDKLGFPTTFFNDKQMQMLIQGTMQSVGAVSLEDFIKNINKELNTK